MSSVPEDKRNAPEQIKLIFKSIINYTVKVCISLTALGLGYLHYRFDKSGIDSIILALFVIAIIPWLSNYLESIEAFGIKAVLPKEISRLKERQSAQKEEINDISARLLSLFVSPNEYSTLKRMSKPEPCPLDLTKPDVENEVRRLFTIKLIERNYNRGFRTLLAEGHDKSSRNIKDHFHLTERGVQYLEMMQTIEKEQPKEDHGK